MADDATNKLLASAGAMDVPSVQNDPSIAATDTSALGLGGPLTTAQTPQQKLRAINRPQLPALIQMLGQMRNPTAQVQAGQMPQAPSRLDSFESFLGNFLTSLATGMAASGHGPGANIRGAGAAMMAPREQNLQNFQMQQEAAKTQSQIEQQQAQTQSLIPSVPMTDPVSGKQVLIPPAHVGTALAGGYRMAGAQIAANQRAQTATTVEGMKEKSAASLEETKQAGANQRQALTLAQKADEFRQTSAYLKWKTQLDDDTKLKVANLTQTKAPAALMQTAVFANGGLRMMSDADAAMQRLEAKGVMGGVGKNKVEDWVFGKGLVDPSLDSQTRKDIGILRASLGYTSTAAMRAHTGRTSQEIYEDFKTRLGPGQDWSALRGAMDETKTLLGDYANAASDESIRQIRWPGAPPSGSGGPQQGTRPPGW